MSIAPNTITIASPRGPFSIIVDDADPDHGAVLAAGWTDDARYLNALVHRTLRPAHISVSNSARDETTVLGAAAQAATAYFEGDLEAVNEIGVRQLGGDFITHAWDVLRTVDPGCTITYAQYAERAGRPAAVRAAAMACARNAAALFVPCHRVLRSDGTFGGFRYGFEVKSWLLAHESTGQDG